MRKEKVEGGRWLWSGLRIKPPNVDNLLIQTPNTMCCVIGETIT
jgi:hypothetical protein